MAGNLKCIKCGKSELDFQQDNRGCEYINIIPHSPEDSAVFLCSECISKFQYSKDIKDLINQNKYPKSPTLSEAMHFVIGEWENTGVPVQDLVDDIIKLLKIHNYEKIKGEQEERQTLDQHKQMYNDKLWKEITYKSKDDGHNTFILLPTLREILETHKILADEKDGM